MSKRKWTDEQFTNAVKNNFSIAGVLRDLGLAAFGAGYATVHKHVKLFGLDTSHWTGKGHLRGKTHNYSVETPLEDVLVEGSEYCRFNLRRRLIKNGILKYQCSLCFLESWKGKPISLHLDHINGVRNDNRIENLRLLCPNCHSQTDTYCGKNKKHR